MREKITQKLLKKVKEDYNSISSEFDKTRQNEWQEFEIFKKYLKENCEIADIGCGNGRLYGFLKKHLKNFRYTGIDNSEKLIEKAKLNYLNKTAENIPSTHTPNFNHGDLLEIPLADNSQDIVFCIAAFHHLPSKKNRFYALNELHRILKKDGILIMSNWNLFQPKYKKYVNQSRLKWLLTLGLYAPRDTFIPWGNTGIKRYYYAFKPKEIKKLLRNSEFKMLEEKTEKNIVTICQKT